MAFIGTRAAAAELGVTDARVRQMIYEGRLPGAFRVGREWLIPSPVVVISRQQAARSRA